MPGETQLQVDGVQVKVTNLSKVFYPKTGFTKGQMIDYYVQVSKYLLPHLRNRPITLKRYPNGVEGLFFYEKQCPPSAPSWVQTIKVAKSDGTINYCEFNDDLPSPSYGLSNLANLELHTFLHKAPALQRPTWPLPFDLDPGAPADILTCGRVALHLKLTSLTRSKSRAFPKHPAPRGCKSTFLLTTLR